eukprot:8793422-Pyramimonas_sp.AAC.1
MARDIPKDPSEAPEHVPCVKRGSKKDARGGPRDHPHGKVGGAGRREARRGRRTVWRGARQR